MRQETPGAADASDYGAAGAPRHGAVEAVMVRQSREGAHER
ncbi:MAG: hypothetical protein NZ699_01450 [Roseiflexus sp.]|nr:hypothetical protein [Roseiflexus sp.]MCS7287776.1 hypothetical protein [Roseiflexus sp.]MDW8147592.1 hypothetical protein [Roseiflexaceae bacterium]MDW8234539.1 hypothetical protein [Roseiflexaceae bacterium]